MIDWSLIGKLIDFCAVYYTTQLVRCAAFSFVLIGLVMLLRRLLVSKYTFLRGMLWSLFLIIPFLGKLKLFYENETVLRITWRITQGTMIFLWVDRVYMAGVFIASICIFGKQLRFRRVVAGMEKTFLGNIRIGVTDLCVTPFTVGLLRPKIVIPQIVLERYNEDELRAVVQHEQTHIRLGHLWFGFAWDILRCLLWVNPFLTMFQKQFRADLEEICDRVCIQNSGRAAHEYGAVLLKTLELLRSESANMPSVITYAGEKEFADMKRRMIKIANFRPYRKRLCVGMAAVAVLAFAVMFLVVHAHSYARCNESRDIMIGSYDGKTSIVSRDTGKLSRMITYDDRYVYVEREAFEDFLEENDAEGEIWIVFGGFYKLPGMAGAAEACVFENGSSDRIVRIPYESSMDNWYLKLIQLL